MRRIVLVAVAILAVVGVVVWLGAPQVANPGKGAAMIQVQVPSLSTIGAQGQKLFEKNCADCHGNKASGQKGVAPPLIHKVYKPSHHADISFQRAAKFGVRAHHWPFGNMPPVEGVTSAEVDKITVFIREVQRANGIK